MTTAISVPKTRENSRNPTMATSTKSGQVRYKRAICFYFFDLLGKILVTF
jgi:hypothetical protein